MKKYRLPIIIGSAILIIALIWTFAGETEQEKEITTKAFVADFEDLVVSTGELMAKNSEEISIPVSMQRFGIYRVQISDIVPEGTYVDSGAYVAALDKTDISSKINDVFVELDKAQSLYTQTQLDTSLTLREKRNAIDKLEFELKQKKIELEQSKYEPPATIQKVKLDEERLQQDLVQTKENYLINKKQGVAKMAEAGAELQKAKNQLEKLQELQKEFRITAPKQGMVVYYREWSGEKRKAGSTVQPWDPAVATLPDLSEMLSKTYINEVEIRKVKVGQKVKLGLDAFPDAMLTGEVTQVANVGETRKGSDTKVFEVEIKVNESDSTYRPGMTTSNSILTNKIEKALQIPLEAVYAQDDKSFVYVRTGTGISRKQVKLGAANAEYVIVLEGVKDGDEVYLSEPESAREKELEVLAARQ
jgi:RND family efflux transporter MFP subunit